MSRAKESFKKGLERNVDTIFAPAVVEVMTRTTMMAYVSAALGGFDPTLMAADSMLAPDVGSLGAEALPNTELQQFKQISLSLENGEELSFIAKIPEGYTFSDLVTPDAEFMEAVRDLKDGQTLKISCSNVQAEELSPSITMTE